MEVIPYREPVLYNYKAVNEIREAAYEIADDYYTSFIMPKEDDENPVLALGLNREIFLTFFCVAHGLASLLANNSMEYDEEHPGKDGNMLKLYEKNEILFAVLWILLYCFVTIPIRGNFGDESVWMLLV